jgi:hypothetical protein
MGQGKRITIATTYCAPSQCQIFSFVLFFSFNDCNHFGGGGYY